MAAGPSGRRRKRRSRVTHARANSGRAAKQPTAPTPEASSLLDASVLSIVANLDGLDLNGLRRQWRAHLDGEPPAHLPRWLLMKVLAYRLQADAFGGLDQSVRRIALSHCRAKATRGLRLRILKPP